MASVRKVQPPAPPPVYVIEVPEAEIETFVKILKCSTYGLGLNILKDLRDQGVTGTIIT